MDPTNTKHTNLLQHQRQQHNQHHQHDEHNGNTMMSKLERNIKDLAEGAKETLEDVVEDVVEDVCEVLPQMHRIVSTMTREHSMFHALKTEIQCVWKHAHWRWANTILGQNLLTPVDEDGEWSFIRKCFKSWNFGPLIQLFLLSFGSILFPPIGVFLLLFLWERSYVTVVGSREASINTARAREKWVFVNGMCIDNNLGNANATQLSKLFNREIQFFHNPTQGLLFDFIECMVGRTFNFQTPVSRNLANCLTSVIQSPDVDRVVLVCHSQGAIISSNAIELLFKRSVDVRKLQVYTFGSAADEFMQVYDQSTKQSYPYYEHYANEYDYVAQIGILHWKVPGNVFITQKVGHFLGEHYIPYFKNRVYHLYCGQSNGKPRLYDYLETANIEKQSNFKLHKKEKPAQPSCPNYPYHPHHGIPMLSPFHSVAATSSSHHQQYQHSAAATVSYASSASILLQHELVFPSHASAIPQPHSTPQQVHLSISPRSAVNKPRTNPFQALAAQM